MGDWGREPAQDGPAQGAEWPCVPEEVRDPAGCSQENAELKPAP